MGPKHQKFSRGAQEVVEPVVLKSLEMGGRGLESQGMAPLSGPRQKLHITFTLQHNESLRPVGPPF